MKFEDSIVINASQEKIYSIYRQVSDWSQWDPETESSSIEGDFVLGTVGKIKPKGAPESKIELIEVTENKSFTVESGLPLCKMHFVHVLNAQEGGTEVINRVIFSGILAPVFSRLIGSGILEGMSKGLQGLKLQAEMG